MALGLINVMLAWQRLHSYQGFLFTKQTLLCMCKAWPPLARA